MRNGQDWSKNTYEEAERAIGYAFQDKELLKTCFTHKSYANNCGGESYERLEFLGDALVNAVASEILFRTYPNATEGELTNLRKQYVSKEALTPVAERMGLLPLMRFSGGDGNNVSKKAPSDLFESVVAGIYLDGGMEEAQRFLERNLTFTEIVDYKSLLNEHVGKAHGEVHYQTSDNAPFICTVTALGKCATGTGENTKAAETEAAKQLLQKLREE